MKKGNKIIILISMGIIVLINLLNILTFSKYENYIENEIRVNNSLFWHRESGTCYNGINNRTTTTACDFTNNGLSEKSKSYIEEVTWNLGGFAGGNINAKRAYEAERGTNVVFEPADYIVRKNEWNGKVALMYPSDYGYAVGGDKRNTCLSNGLYYYDINDCATNNWLYNKVYTWLLSPSLTATDPYYIFSNGGVNHYNGAFFSYAVRPTVYLKSDVKILASDKPNYGSINNPFKII